MHQGDRQQGAAASGSGGIPVSEGAPAHNPPPAAAAAALSLAQRWEMVRAALGAVTGLEGVLHQGLGSQLGPLLGDLDALRRGCEAAQVGTVAEAVERGEATASHASAMAWVLEWAPSYRCGGVKEVVTVAQACAGRPVGSGHVLDHGSLRRLHSCVLSGRVGVRGAAVALAEMHKLAPRLTPAAVPTVWAGFLHVAEVEGPSQVKTLRERIIAEHGRDQEFQVRQDRLKHGVSLSRGRADDGMVEYLLRLDPEGASVLEAAIGPLSAPNPVDGVSDLRSSDQRRGDALVQVCRRSATAGEDVSAQPKAMVYVTMGLDDLKDACGAGTVLGNGTLLAPETVRRIACDAGIIPVVLGTDSEVLDLGRTRRLFTPAQLRYLWLRDKGCTIPGCTVPPWWCDGHHVIHWVDGGPTDKHNAALLCGRHHTLAHQRGWTATVNDAGVTWHL